MSLDAPRIESGAAVPPRVLIVDDAADLREMLKLFLGACSLDFDEAANGDEAMQLFDESLHFVMLLDLMMPKKDGFQVMRELAERNPHLLERVIVLSGGGSQVTKAVDSRVYGVVSKPFATAELMGTIRRCLAQNQSIGHAS